MKLKPLVAMMAFVLPGVASASFTASPGHYSTLATATPGQRLHSVSIGNPAASTFLIDRDEHVRLGLFHLPSADAELFDIPSYSTSVTDMYNEFWDSEKERVDLGAVIESQDDIMGTLESFGNDAYAEVRAQITAPLFPLAVRLPNEGVLTFNWDAYTELRLSLLYSDISLDAGNEDQPVTTDTAAYLKEAAITEFSVGYSQPIWYSPFGNFHAGTRLNIMYGALGKQLYGMSDADNNIEDLVESDYLLSSFAAQPAFGLDLGLLWETSLLSMGVTAKNVNQPELNYGTLGNNCLSADYGEAEQTNCFTALSQSNKISLNETHVRELQWVADASLYTPKRHFSLSTSVDLNPVNSLTGQQQQYASAGLTYYKPDWKLAWVFTGMRAGYTKNLVGDQLDHITAGLTLFGGVELDATLGGADFDGFEVKTADGELDETVPFYARKASIALSINEKF